MGLPKLFYFVILPLTLWIFRRYLYLIYAVPVAAVNAVGSAVAGTGLDADHDSLKSLMSNVTSDYNQLANLMQEFVALPDVPPETETRLRNFLATKASMSFPTLELYLDIVIKVYWIVMPVLVVVVLARVFGSSDGKGAEAGVKPDLAAVNNGINRRSATGQNGMQRRSNSGGDVHGGRGSGGFAAGVPGDAGHRPTGHRVADPQLRRPSGR